MLNLRRSVCLHCRELIFEFWKTDCFQAEAVEQLVIELNGSNDDADDDGDNCKDEDYSH